MSGTPVKFEVLLTDGAEQDLESIGNPPIFNGRLK